MASGSSKKEFRTSVILTERQFKRVREIAQANDASTAWVLRQAIDRYLGHKTLHRRIAVEKDWAPRNGAK